MDALVLHDEEGLTSVLNADERTSEERWTIGTVSGRESENIVLSLRFDNYDDDILYKFNAKNASNS